MFQTDLHHSLQTFDHEWFILFMQAISEMGRRSWYLFFVLLLLFVAEYRRGFAALQCLLWASGITVWLKDLSNMPRPYAVDATLKVFGPVDGSFRLAGTGAPGFWTGLPAETLARLRTDPELSNGFPSGHVSGATAFWLSAGLLFRNTWLIISSFFFILLTMLSRLYLGMHFLADVTGGLLIGLGVAGAMYLMLLHRDTLLTWTAMQLADWSQWLLFVAGPLLFALLPHAPAGIAGQLLGLNAAVWLTCRNGFPESRAVWWKRTLRMTVAIAFFIGADLLVVRILALFPGGAGFLREGLTLFLAIGGATALCIRINLFERPATA